MNIWIVSLMAALLLQGAARVPAPASLTGVARGASGEPLANVRVWLGNSDTPMPQSVVDMLASEPPPFEKTLPGEFAAVLLREAEAEAAPGRPPVSMPEGIREIVVRPDGSSRVVIDAAPPVWTDNEGRFFFENIPPGTYRLTFAKNGYVRRDYGQHGAASQGVPIVLAAGEKRSGIEMRMVPAGAIGGHILGPAGRPAAGVSVHLFRYAYDASGQRKLQRVASTETDDRGEYRLYFVSPGRYYLGAGSGEDTGAALMGLEAALLGLATPTHNRIPREYALTYYPGVFDADSAAIIEVQPGAELGGVDLSLSPQRTYRVRGRVIDGRSGKAPTVVRVSLLLHAPTGGFDISGGLLNRPRYDSESGTFEVTNVRPGEYTVVALGGPATPTPPPPGAGLPPDFGVDPALTDPINRGAPRAREALARVAAPVRDGDIDGIVLTLAPSFSLAGTVRIERNPPDSPLRVDRLRIQLKPAGLSGGTPLAEALMGNPPPVQAAKEDGGFVLDSVYPGEYRVVLLGLPAGFYVKQARVGDVDVLNAARLLPTGNSSENSRLEILVSPNVARVEGIASGPGGAPAPGAQVVLAPSASRERIELFRVATAGPDGRFTFQDVTPGSYKLVAWEAIEPYSWFDPALLRQIDESARSIQVEESSRLTTEVNVIPAE